MAKERRMVVRGGRKNARAGANETVAAFWNRKLGLNSVLKAQL